MGLRSISEDLRLNVLSKYVLNLDFEFNQSKNRIKQCRMEQLPAKSMWRF